MGPRICDIRTTASSALVRTCCTSTVKQTMPTVAMASSCSSNCDSTSMSNSSEDVDSFFWHQRGGQRTQFDSKSRQPFYIRSTIQRRPMPCRRPSMQFNGRVTSTGKWQWLTLSKIVLKLSTYTAYCSWQPGFPFAVNVWHLPCWVLLLCAFTLTYTAKTCN